LRVPPSSNIDVFADDVGFIAIMDKKGGLADINVTTGGETWKQEDVPEQPITSVSAQWSKAKDVAEKIRFVQRDHGNRVEYVFDQTVCRVVFPDASRVVRTPG